MAWRWLALTAALTAATLAGGAAQAQSGPLPGLPNATAEDGAPAEGAATPELGAATAASLIDLLRDDAARAALLAELERVAAGAAPDGGAASAPDAAAGEGGASAPPDATPAPGVGRRLADATQAVAQDAAEQAIAVWNGLTATQRRLTALWGARSGDLVDAVEDVAIVAVVTLALFVLLRLLARRVIFRHLGALADRVGPMRTALAFAGSVAVDAATVLIAWAAGYAIVTLAVGDAGRIALSQTLYLNAFLAVEMAKVALRAVLAPSESRLRPVPLTDRAARYWNGRISALVSILGYGVMLVTPLVNATISVFTGRAVLVVIHVIVLLWSMALVIRHRRAPYDWLSARHAETGGDATIGLLKGVARIWHWPALAWLVALFASAVTRSGAVGPMLLTTGKVALIGVLGAGAGALAARLARKGVALPERITGPTPMLEARINGFLSRVLGVARLLILAVTLGAMVDATGLLDIGGWFARTFGADFGGRLLSAALVATAAFALWLALASWVDYRLNPERGVPSAREQTLLTLMRNAVTVALVILAGMIALSEIGLDIGPLLASAGVLGLAIGFGAQKLVQDVITGVFIQLENAINVGDVVTAGGTTGVVEKLTIRSVSLRDLNGVFHVIPFSSVDMVSNFMKGFAFHVADLGIAYREQVEDGKQVMHDAFDELRDDPDYGPDILGPLEWFGVNELGDSAVMLRARIRTRPGKQWGVGRAYNGLLKKHCDRAGVEIPFPHLTLWFGEGKDGMAPPARVAPLGGAPLAPPPGRGGGDVPADAPDPDRPRAEAAQ